MGHTPKLALGALTAFLVAFPLVLPRPGVPTQLKADEPAYFAMALSLARDGDLRVEPKDLRRIVEAFPFYPTRNLILMSDDGWETVYFGKPYVYSLFAAPAAALAGPGGMIAFNMVLLLAAVWLGAVYLARFNPGGVAVLFSAGFFMISPGFAYAFWIHPEVFNMAAVALSLFLVFHRFASPRIGAVRGGRGWASVRRALWNEHSRPALAGAALALAVYNKPMLLALGLPALYRYGWRRRRPGQVAAWIGGLVLCLAGVAATATALTGHPTAYMGVARGSYEVCDPDVLPVTPADVPEQARAATAASWSWILGMPDVPWRELAENLVYFFVGRHTGLFLYFPFALVATVLFLAHGRRSGLRWTVVAAVAAVALFFLLWIPFNWHGGGGFIGNRYFVNAYPALLFLVTRIAPVWTVGAGYLLGGVFLGTIVFTPLGRAMASPTLQFHVRSPVFTPFPPELSLRQIPGYHDVDLRGVRLRVRKDQVLPRGDALWLRGADRVELWLLSLEPLDRLAFSVASPAPSNRVGLEVAGARTEVAFDRPAPLPDGSGPGPRHVVELAPEGPTRVRWAGDTPIYVYRLVARIDTGEIRTYTAHLPPERCETFAYNASWEESFFVGAELLYLGAPDLLERDVFAVAWREVEAPDRVAAGGELTVLSTVENTSDAVWPAAGTVRVNLSYHWLDAEGRRVVQEGPRSPLPADVPPGGRAVVRQGVRAPERPGAYTLVLEPLYEHVAWFSSRLGDAALHRIPVEVVEGASDPPGRRRTGPPGQ